MMLTALLLAPALHAAAAAPQPLSASDLQFFESKIRPILADNCYQCHSRQADKVKGGLLLDTREGVLHGGNSGKVIEPGKPDASVLIQAVRHTDPTLQMPEDGKLTDQQVADLTEWVRRGAPDPRDNAAKGSSPAYGGVGRQHWSFLPVKKPAVPAVQDQAWVQSPVDSFILQKLEAAGIKPNAPADKRTLLRRVSFDLTGLPPTAAELDAFLADTSPGAFAKVVDRLLASPQYGERWGRHWLDVARYADTKGDPPRQDDARYPHAWTYRDWVIDAFNRDLPYDQFIKLQLAADLLMVPPANNPGRGGRAGAAGRAGQPNAPRGNVAANALANAAARGGRGNEPAPFAVPAGADRTSLAALGFLTVGNQFDGNIHEQINDRIDVTSKAFLGLTVSCARCHDHKFDPIPTKDYYSFYGIFANSIVPTDMSTWPTLAATDPNSAELQDYLAKLTDLKRQETEVQQQLQQLRQAQRGGRAGAPAGQAAPVRPNAAAPTPGGEKSPAPTVAGVPPPRAGAAPAPAAANPMANAMGGSMDMGNAMGNSMEMGGGMTPPAASATPGAPANAAARGNLTPAQGLQALQRQRDQVARAFTELELTHPGALPKSSVILDRPNAQNFPVLVRGEAQNRGEVVPRRFLEILSGPNRPAYTKGSGRLELANDIASPANPLTARTLINRVWQLHFGAGFVATPDDLGNMSSPPTHPELLDYLAARFTEEGWSLKKLHRMIVLSSTYQESGLANPQYADVDPENKLLWRSNLRRLDFEAVHDSLLAIAGSLDRTVGGRPVPIGSADFATRRAIYTFIDRANPAEILTQFDFPNPSVVAGRRYDTIVPQQSLFLMNSPLVIETARKLAHRPDFLALRSNEDKIRSLYLAIFQRPPTAEETAFCVTYVRNNPQGASSEVAAARAGTPQGRAQSNANAQARNQALQAERAMQGAARGRGTFQAEPAAAAFPTRDPLDVWTKLAHSLFQTNEAMFIN